MVKTSLWNLVFGLSFALTSSIVFAKFASALDDEKSAEQKGESDEKNDDKTGDETGEEDDKPKGPSLTIGSKAPSLDIEHWIQDGEGKYKPVTDFEKDKVYIVEFWATWCGPCIRSMPHLAELQKKYHDKGVRIVSISDEDLETVEDFLEREVKGDEDKTYHDITKVYSLTTDPDGSVNDDYMEASQQNGIPTAFIVGKTGHIEWIGHPMAMDDPLKEVLDDKWDRDAYLVKLQKEQELEEKMREVIGLAQSGDLDESLKLIDELVKESPKENQMQLKQMKFGLLMQAERIEDAVVVYLGIAEENKRNTEMLNMMAWSVVRASSRRTAPEELLVAATKVAKMGIEGDPKNGPLFDTLAHLQHLSGDLDAAIATQEKAVEFVGDKSELSEGIREYLEELKEEKEDSNKKEKDDEQKPDADEK